MTHHILQWRLDFEVCGPHFEYVKGADNDIADFCVAWLPIAEGKTAPGPYGPYVLTPDEGAIVFIDNKLTKPAEDRYHLRPLVLVFYWLVRALVAGRGSMWVLVLAYQGNSDIFTTTHS